MKSAREKNKKFGGCDERMRTEKAVVLVLVPDRQRRDVSVLWNW